MKTYLIDLTARREGSIGIFWQHRIDIQAESIDAAYEGSFARAHELGLEPEFISAIRSADHKEFKSYGPKFF